MSHADVVKHIYERVSHGDFQTLLDSLAPDMQWKEAPNIPYDPGHVIVGPEALQRLVFDRIDADFETFDVEVRRIVDGGPVVLVEGRYLGMTGSGTKLDAMMAHVWEFGSEDKVIDFQQYSDTWQWRRVLGVDQPGPGTA